MLAQLLNAASICDGICKGLRHEDWPLDPWASLRRLVLMAVRGVTPTPHRRTVQAAIPKPPAADPAPPVRSQGIPPGG